MESWCIVRAFVTNLVFIIQKITYCFILFKRKEFEFEKITVLNLNPDFRVQTEQMYNGNPYPFGLDPVNFLNKIEIDKI